MAKIAMLRGTGFQPVRIWSKPWFSDLRAPVHE